MRTHLDYTPPEKRIFTLMTQLESRLAEPMRLGDLARQACYSPHHFDRIFSEQVGQTPMDYLRRRRLQQACTRVRYENTPIAQIAIESGFASDSAFAKVFRQQFGYSAREWRQGAWRTYMDDIFLCNLKMKPKSMLEGMRWHNDREIYRQNIAERVVVREQQPSQYLYRRWRGLMGDELLATIEQTIADITALRTWDSTPQLVCVDREDNGFVRIDQLFFDFGLLLTGAHASLAEQHWPGFLRGDLPGGLYACLPYVEHFPLWRWMHEDWLERQSYYTFDSSRPYLSVGQQVNGVASGELWMPIKRQRG